MEFKNNFDDTTMDKIRFKNKLSKRSLFIIIFIVGILCMAISNVSASISPDYVPWKLEAGECYTIEETIVEIPGESQKVDVVFSFDLTKKMEEILNTMKSENEEIMNTLITTYPSVSFNFGVMSHTDYPKKFTSCDYTNWYGVTNFDYAYSLDKPLTNITTAVTTAINSLSIKDGWDPPENYARIFYESYNDSNIGWRKDAKKLLINFANSIPHDCNLNENVTSGTWSTGRDPGRDEIMNTSDDLDLLDVLASMNSSGITLIECHSNTSYLNYWDYWTGITGGSVYITNSSNLVDVVEDAITNKLTFSKIYDLHLEITTPVFENWSFSVSPASYPEVNKGESVKFNETICVPDGTPPGVYEFNVSAVDGDRVYYGNQTNVVTLNSPPVANDDNASTNEDISIWIDVLANDTDDDGSLNLSTVVVTSGPSDGITSVNTTTGEIEYTPDSNFYGSDSFTYTVDDDDGATSNEATVTITIESVNDPPDAPINPDPEDDETNVDVNHNLYWDGGDPDGDSVTYDVYFGTSSSPPLEASGITVEYYDPGAMDWETMYYWRIVAEDEHGVTTIGPIWSFTTEDAPEPPPPPPPPPPENTNPIADASAGEPYIGLVGEDITFDGANSYDPDAGGYIASWHWDFDDGTDGSGEIITHNYSSARTYNVTLTVIDNEGATDAETFSVVIAITNNPPENLVVDGPLTGKQDTDYAYNASATDLDDDDMLRFIFEWDDGTTATSEVVDSGIIATVTHNWSSYGVYEVTVTAEDNYSAQISTTFDVLIGVIVIEGEITGLIIDEDGNDPFDVFNNSDTEAETEVELDNGSYLIDSDGDNKWDYAYDPDEGLITYYEFVYQKFFIVYQEVKSTPGFELISVLAMLALITIILRRKRKK